MRKKIVSEIWVYPVKSLGGIQLSSAKVLPKGLEHDRRWMLIDTDNVAMTQRVYPAMALFKPIFENNHLRITYDEQAIDLPFSANGEKSNAIVWNDTVAVQEVSPGHSSWFSERLGVPCRLVFFPEPNRRPVEKPYSVSDEDVVSLADAYPLLVIGQASLDDLNSRLNEPLPMNRFRPNIVFTGGDPYEEDDWGHFRIGESRFAAVKPCSRCAVPTIDQATGKKGGAEPLATLAGYRKRGNNVYFGQNLLVLNDREIAMGDEIILE
jgi:uncharacterized protein YcbX